MKAIKIIAYIAAAVIILFGVLFIWGAFSPDGSLSWIFIGLISVGIGFGLIWFASRQKSDVEPEGQKPCCGKKAFLYWAQKRYQLGEWD